MQLHSHTLEFYCPEWPIDFSTSGTPLECHVPLHIWGFIVLNLSLSFFELCLFWALRSLKNLQDSYTLFNGVFIGIFIGFFHGYTVFFFFFFKCLDYTSCMFCNLLFRYTVTISLPPQKGVSEVEKCHQSCCSLRTLDCITVMLNRRKILFNLKACAHEWHKKAF